MKLKASVAAMLLALSGTAAWAGDSPEAIEQNRQADPTAAEQSSDAAPDIPAGWHYINGESAASEGQGGANPEAATSLGFTESDQAAAAGAEEKGETSATSDDESGSDRSAQSDDQDASDEQSAQSEDEGHEQSAQSPNPAADLEGKVVVIIPRDWQGSIPGLITALESSPDAKDIVVVQQGDPQAGNSGVSDDYSADRSRPADSDQQ